MSDDSTQGTETPTLTWLDVYEHSKVIYERLCKCSKRAIAHHLAFDLAVQSDLYRRENLIEETLQDIKKLEPQAKSERDWDSYERKNKEFEKLKANGWRKPRRKRRKKRLETK